MNIKLTKKYVNPVVGIGILCGTVGIIFSIGIAGALLGSEYESSCSAKPGEEPICTTRYAYKGLGNLDISMPSLNTIAIAIGGGFGIYATIKSGKLPAQFRDMIDGEEAA